MGEKIDLTKREKPQKTENKRRLKAEKENKSLGESQRTEKRKGINGKKKKIAIDKRGKNRKNTMQQKP